MAESPSGNENENNAGAESQNTGTEVITAQDVDQFAQPFLLADASGSKDLYNRQLSQREMIRNNYEQCCQDVKDTSKCCRAEVRTEIPGEAAKVLEKAKKELYMTLGISENIDKNDFRTEFKRGFVDGLVGENIELAKEILSKGLDSIVENLSKAFESAEKMGEFLTEVLKGVSNEFKRKIDQLKEFNPYGYGNAIGGLGIGFFGSIFKSFGKNVVKTGIKEAKAETESIAKNETKVSKGGKDGVDHMQIRANFIVNDSTPLRDVSQKMSGYAETLSAHEILKDPDRLQEVFDIIKPMLSNARTNVEKIKNMSKMEFGGYFAGFQDMQRGLILLEKSPLLNDKVKKTLSDFRLGEIQNTQTLILKLR